MPELHRRDATAPGRAEHGQRVARGQPAAIDEPGPRGEVRDPESGGLGVGETGGNEESGVGADEALLRERTVSHPERGDAHDVVADRQVDPLSERGDDAGRLLSRDERQRGSERVRAAAHEHIGQSDARRGHADADLTGPGLGRFELDFVQHVDRLAHALYLPRTHQVTTSPSIAPAALSSNRSTCDPKNSWIGLSDCPRRNLA